MQEADPKYFQPDRSNRPTNEGDPWGETNEVGGFEGLVLADGRPCVVEIAIVSGVDVYYYYFDARGLEDATEEELADLLRSSRVSVPDPSSRDGVSIQATRKSDARGRAIIEFAVFFMP